MIRHTLRPLLAVVLICAIAAVAKPPTTRPLSAPATRPTTNPIAGVIPAGGTLRQRQNAGEIKAYGFEGEVAGDITPALGWRAAVAATHARVDGGSSAPQLTVVGLAVSNLE